MSSGMQVLCIQKAWFDFSSNQKIIPWSSPILVRYISPRCRSWSFSAISMVILVACGSAKVTEPRRSGGGFSGSLGQWGSGLGGTGRLATAGVALTQRGRASTAAAGGAGV